MNINCPAESFARSGIFFPIYWLQTTAPPVANADKICIKSTLMLSTSDTPDTAASPQDDTMSVSNRPMLIAKVCSMISGMISFFKSALVNSNPSIKLPFSFACCYFIYKMSTFKNSKEKCGIAICYATKIRLSYVCYYASAAVMIAIEYTSEALHPRDKSLIGAFSPSKIGPYASKLPRRCAIL